MASAGRSEPTELTCGVPQGFVMGPVTFTAYTEDLHATIERFSRRYAAAGCCSAERRELSSPTPGRLCYRYSRMVCTTKAATEPWNDLIELIWFGRRANLERLQAMDIAIRLGHVDIEAADCVRDLGVVLDSSLSMRQHVARVTSTCVFFQPNTRHWRPIATCLLSNTDPHRLLQLCARLSVQLRSGAAAASTSRGRAVCHWLAATGPLSQLHCRHCIGVLGLLISCAYCLWLRSYLFICTPLFTKMVASKKKNEKNTYMQKIYSKQERKQK